jgi:hypothetical protein
MARRFVNGRPYERLVPSRIEEWQGHLDLKAGHTA